MVLTVLNVAEKPSVAKAITHILSGKRFQSVCLYLHDIHPL